MVTALTLSILADRLAVCRLAAEAAIPAWAWGGGFCSITRTADELSIICPETQAPPEAQGERGWRAIKFEGPFDFALTGILAAVAAPLAEAGISMLALATYDTDYVLVKEAQLAQACAVLERQGLRVLSV